MKRTKRKNKKAPGVNLTGAGKLLNEEKLSIVETTSSNLDELKSIKNKLFNKNLISCAKIFGPIDVSYKWDGKIIDDKEFLLRLLSKTSFFQEIKEIIKKNHSYDVPEIISFEVNNSSTDYKKWALNI